MLPESLDLTQTKKQEAQGQTWPTSASSFNPETSENLQVKRALEGVIFCPVQGLRGQGSVMPHSLLCFFLPAQRVWSARGLPRPPHTRPSSSPFERRHWLISQRDFHAPTQPRQPTCMAVASHASPSRRMAQCHSGPIASQSADDRGPGCPHVAPCFGFLE